jgi:hypothetical protein
MGKAATAIVTASGSNLVIARMDISHSRDGFRDAAY